MSDLGESASIQPLLSPNAYHIRAHLEHLFGECLKGWIEIIWTPADSGDLKYSKWFDVGDIDGAVEKAVQANSVPGQNVYIGAAVRHPDSLPNGRGSDADFYCSTAFYCDLDDPGVAENAFPLLQHCKPTLAVITGRRPYTRAQLWWRLEDANFDPDQHRKVCKSLATYFKGDNTVVNPGRAMRLGGSVAWPKKSARVLEMTETMSFKDGRPLKMYSGQLEQAYPSQSDQPNYTRTDDEGRSKFTGEYDVAWLLNEVRSGRNWHKWVIRLVAHWVGKGWSDAEIEAVAASITLPGYTVQRTIQDLDIAGARKRYQKPNPQWEVPPVPEDTPSEDFKAYQVDDKFLTGIGPRKWLYGNKLIRDFCTLLVSPGGVGKTAFTIGMAVACQTGKQILGDKPHKPMNVWGFYLEEPKEEIQRRMLAAKMVYKTSIGDPEPGQLLVSSGRDQQLLVAKSIGKEEFVMMPDVQRLENQIRRQKTDVLIIDPFVKTHTIPENENVLVEKVVTIFNEIAGRTGCSIFLVHHTRKGAVAGDAESSRGASSIVGNVRAAFTLAAMTQDDAKELGVSADERRFLIRLDDAKANMAPKSEKAEWIKLVSQNLGNGDDEYPNGDNVQVVSQWLPPDLWEGVSAHTANQILDCIAAGQTQEDGTVEYYTDAKSSKSRWAGIPIMRILAENGHERNEAQAQQIIKRWLDVEPPILEISDYLSGKGKEKRRCLIVNNANRPGAK